MTVVQSSWIVSIKDVGGISALLPAGILVNIYGRKNVLLAAAPMIILSWLVIIFARSVEMLCAASVLQGAATTFLFTVSPLYLGEISDVTIRGLVGTLYFGAYFCGILIEYLMGYFLRLELLPYFNLIAPFTFLVLFFNMPESPHFSLVKCDKDTAVRDLEWLRDGNTKDQIQDEFASIVNYVEVKKNSKSSVKDIIATRGSRKALLIVMSTATVRIFSGSAAVACLAVSIFQAAGTSFLAPKAFAILMATVQLIGFFFSAPSVDYLGRRFLLLWSIFICGICQIIVAIYFYFKIATSLDVQYYSWIPPVCLSIYFFFIALGSGTLLGVLKNELFVLNTRGLASVLAGVMGITSEFVSLKTYQLIAVNYGIYWNHVIFAAFSAYGVIVYAYFLPETKGLTFDEIQNLLEKKI